MSSYYLTIYYLKYLDLNIFVSYGSLTAVSIFTQFMVAFVRNHISTKAIFIIIFLSETISVIPLLVINPEHSDMSMLILICLIAF